MPPRSLLFQREVRTTVHDLAGANAETLWTFIASLNATVSRDVAISIVQPGSLSVPMGLEPVACYGPHLATEDLSIEAFCSRPLRALALCEYVLRSPVQ